VFAKVTVVKIVSYGASVCDNELPEGDVTTPKHVGALSM
jgi:hypothetical protein